MDKNWTGKSRGNSFFQFLFRLTVKLGGANAAYFFLYFVSFAFTCFPSIIKGASYYLKRRFPKDKVAMRFFRTYKLNLTFGKILIDKTVFGIKGKVNIISSKQDQEKCRLLSKDKGLIILTAHCGAWQTAMSAFDFIETQKFVVYKKVESDVDKHSFEISGKTPPINFIDPSSFDGGALEIMSALSKKSVVCIMGDRVFGESKNCVSVNFLGEQIIIPLMPYRISAVLGVPIIVIFFPRRNKGSVDSWISDSFYVKDKGVTISNYAEDAQKFASALESFTKKWPYQFFNYFDMWRQK